MRPPYTALVDDSPGIDDISWTVYRDARVSETKLYRIGFIILIIIKLTTVAVNG